MLIKDAAESYMADRAKRLRESTLEGYRSSLATHVLPYWGHAPIEEITPEDLQDWVDTRFPGIPGGAEKAYKTLRQVIRFAIRKLGVRCWDPTTAGIELPKKNRYRAKTLDASGVKSYLRALWGDATEAVAICAVTLGLRRGEACGLRWSDIDLRSGEVRIRRSRQWVHGHEVVVDPKTDKSARSYYLPKFALARLRQIRRESGGRGWLCAMPAHRIARRIKAVCARAGAACVSMTECRHTWATLAVEAGVGIETVAMMMGHTDISTAYEHYIVPRPRVCKDAQRAWARLVMS